MAPNNNNTKAAEESPVNKLRSVENASAEAGASAKKPKVDASCAQDIAGEQNLQGSEDAQDVASAQEGQSNGIEGSEPQNNEGNEDAVASAWMQLLNLSPPSVLSLHGGDFAEFQSIKKVQQLMREDEMDEFIIGEGQTPTDEQRIVHFLYGMLYAFDATKEERKTRIRAFLVGDAKSRILSILRSSNTTVGVVDEAMGLLWRDCQKKVLRCSKLPNAKTIFSQTKNIELNGTKLDREKWIPFVAHVQTSNNSYFHSTARVVSYKVAFDKAQADNTNEDTCVAPSSLDVSKLVRQSYRGAELEARVVENKGGSSRELLAKLIEGMGYQTEDASISTNAQLMPTSCDRAFAMFALSGPALVRRFATEDGFRGLQGMTTGEDTIHQCDIDEHGEDTFTVLELPTDNEGVVFDKIQQACLPNGRPTNRQASAIPASLDSNEGNHSSSSEPANEGEGRSGRHAMVMVGCRRENGKYWFLLQNTWKTAPLVEVSGEFLASRLHAESPHAKGSLVFLSGSNRSGALPERFGNSNALVLESDLLDGGDEVDEEDDDISLEG